MSRKDCEYQIEDNIKRPDGIILPRAYCWLKDIVIADDDGIYENCSSYVKDGVKKKA